MDYKKYIADEINIEGVTKDEIYDLIALPPNTEMGDYALPCFKFAKVLRKKQFYYEVYTHNNLFHKLYKK